MEGNCGNCVNFVQLSIGVCEHHWGTCTKSVDSKGKGSFKWDDKTCEDFTAKKARQNVS